MGACVIYALRAISGTGAVKIGYTSGSIHRRALELATGSNEPLACIGMLDGGRLEEEKIHRALMPSWSHGEWFHWADATRQFVATMNAYDGGIIKPQRGARRFFSPRESFEAKVKKTDGCWVWPFQGATRRPNRITWTELSGRVHHLLPARVAYESYIGPVGDAYVIRACRNIACVRPDHLRLSEKMPGPYNGKRYCPAHHLRMFTAEQVRNIRMSDATDTQVARELGTGHAVIQQIRARRTYRNVP